MELLEPLCDLMCDTSDMPLSEVSDTTDGAPDAGLTVLDDGAAVAVTALIGASLVDVVVAVTVLADVSSSLAAADGVAACVDVICFHACVSVPCACMSCAMTTYGRAACMVWPMVCSTDK